MFDADVIRSWRVAQNGISKGKVQKIYHTPHGVVSAERPVYQPAEGGKTFCPMDARARIIRKAVPRLRNPGAG